MFRWALTLRRPQLGGVPECGRTFLHELMGALGFERLERPVPSDDPAVSYRRSIDKFGLRSLDFPVHMNVLPHRIHHRLNFPAASRIRLVISSGWEISER